MTETPNFPSQLLEQRLEEINVSGYVRHGKHGLVRVSRYTRDAGSRGAIRAAWHTQAMMPHRRAEREVAGYFDRVVQPGDKWVDLAPNAAGVRRRLTGNAAREWHLKGIADVHAAKRAGHGDGQSRYKKTGDILTAGYGKLRNAPAGKKPTGPGGSRRSGTLSGAGKKVRDVPNRTLNNLRARRPADAFSHRGPDPRVGKSRKSGHLSGAEGRKLRVPPPRVLKDTGKRFAHDAAGNAVASSLSRMPDGAKIAGIADLLVSRSNKPGNKRTAARLARDLSILYAHLQRGNLDTARIQGKRIKELYGIPRLNIRNKPGRKLS